MNKIPDMYIQKFEYKDSLDKLTKVLQLYALMINLKVGKIYLRPKTKADKKYNLVAGEQRDK